MGIPREKVALSYMTARFVQMKSLQSARENWVLPDGHPNPPVPATDLRRREAAKAGIQVIGHDLGQES